MKYCENGDHRYHIRPKLVEPMHGDSGWLCPGSGKSKKRTATRRKNAAIDARFFRILKLVNELSRKFPVPVPKKRKKR